jgi:hypothetical protein
MSRRLRSLRRLMAAMVAPAALIALAGGLTPSAGAAGRLPLDSSPGRVNFGALAVGAYDSSTTGVVTYTNRTASPVTISYNIPTEGDYADFGFSSTSCNGQTLSPGGTCTNQYFFHPQAIGHAYTERRRRRTAAAGFHPQAIGRRTMTLWLTDGSNTTRIAKTVLSGRGVAP